VAARAGGPLSRPRVATRSTRRFSGGFAGLPADALLAGQRPWPTRQDAVSRPGARCEIRPRSTAARAAYFRSPGPAPSAPHVTAAARVMAPIDDRARAVLQPRGIAVVVPHVVRHPPIEDARIRAEAVSCPELEGRLCGQSEVADPESMAVRSRIFQPSSCRALVPVFLIEIHSALRLLFEPVSAPGGL
jgi:hypothetical protein